MQEAGLPRKLAAAMAALSPATGSLRSIELKPRRGLSGRALFEHMVQFRMRNSDQALPSPIFGVEMAKRLAQRKLIDAGAITSHFSGYKATLAELKAGLCP